jgi:signal transduction histidine kinase
VTLADFIRANMEPILAEWEDFARTRLPASRNMSQEALRDHAQAILEAIAADMEVSQSGEERVARSRGRGEQHRMDAPGETHASTRVDEGFSVEQLVSEYRALRSSVLSLWEKSSPDIESLRRGDVTRFNEALDQALTASVTRFARKLSTYRDQFLGVLGHDLRNPIGAIEMAAMLMARSDDHAIRRAGSRILSSTGRMTRMIADLLDVTRTRLGGRIPITRSPVDLASIARQVVEETQCAHPDRVIDFETHGRLHGEWDADRLAQVLSNLLSNAIQHGREDTPVSLVLRDEGEVVVFSVHNEGPPIREEIKSMIFEPLMRNPTNDEDGKSTTSLGLGLFVVREVVAAHDGTVEVTSSARDGTTFEVRLPRGVHLAPEQPHA